MASREDDRTIKEELDLKLQQDNLSTVSAQQPIVNENPSSLESSVIGNLNSNKRSAISVVAHVIVNKRSNIETETPSIQTFEAHDESNDNQATSEGTANRTELA